MRYPESEKLEIIRLVEKSYLLNKQTLDNLGIARTTFFGLRRVRKMCRNLPSYTFYICQDWRRTRRHQGRVGVVAQRRAYNGRGPGMDHSVQWLRPVHSGLSGGDQSPTYVGAGQYGGGRTRQPYIAAVSQDVPRHSHYGCHATSPTGIRQAATDPQGASSGYRFYTGCNPVRTPHLLFNTTAVLDALEVDYEVVGCQGECCGIIQLKWEEDQASGESVVDGSISRFAGFQPKAILSWCLSCVLHLGKTIAGFRKVSFEFDHVTNYLLSRAEGLADKFIRSVNERVLLHTHDA